MAAHRLTRFAPAPTGLLHLGHVLNAIYVWGLARRIGARVLLRIEDHDAQRSRRDFESRLLDDLDWLGFVPDIYPTRAFRGDTCSSRQSDRSQLYAAVGQHLIANGLVYGCDCTRQDIARYQATHGWSAPACPSLCAGRGLPPSDGLTWRVRINPGEEPFVDLLCGSQTQDPARHDGDIAIRDRHGNWTYTFAVVVDDMCQQVDLVIRGRDLLPATGAQIRLARAIGRTHPPEFAHHPVLMKTPTQKLSKADGATGICELRRAGWTPARVIGHAAALGGLAPAGREITAAAVSALFPRDQFASTAGRNESPDQK